MIKLYTTGCPKCKVLKKKLDEKVSPMLSVLTQMKWSQRELCLYQYWKLRRGFYSFLMLLSGQIINEVG